MSVPKPGRANATITRYKSERARWNKQTSKLKGGKNNGMGGNSTPWTNPRYGSAAGKDDTGADNT